ncbi:MAG: DUF3943 domain-containing protein [Tannerella sp.]|jgi:hypothetical protein|nr:DUF3943 domain-containing protein [Tannerella sp.]
MNYLKYLLILLIVSPLKGQSLEIIGQDSIGFEKETIPVRKRPLLAASEIVGINIGVWAFDRYAIRGSYAYISLNSMQRNLREGFHWDNDKFATNLFFHPYHGSLYYNSARSNGLNFNQSALFTVGGSLMWELLMEKELPSTNDWIMTGIGGIAMGEIFFRTSDLILDNSAHGSNRLGREIAGFIIAPGRGLTRILTGEAWKITSARGKRFQSPNVEFSLATGIKTLELRNMDEETFDESTGFVLNGQMEYGDLFESDNQPFSYFSANLDLNIQKNQPLIGQFNFMGRLIGKTVFENANNQLYLGAYYHFDYYDSDSLAYAQKVRGTKTPYVVGTPAAVGGGLVYEGNFFNNRFKMKSQTHANAVLLGASLSDYYRGDERNYNFGSGYAIKELLCFSYKNKFSFAFNTFYSLLLTWKGYDRNTDFTNFTPTDYEMLNVQGDKSKAHYTILESILGYDINPRWGICYQRFDFFRKTNYAYLPDFKTTTSDERVIVRYKF